MSLSEPTDRERVLSLRFQLQTLITAKRAVAYTDPSKATDADALGLLVASWSDFDGVKICEAFLSALEDANFHTLRAALAPIIAADLET